jgi:hypothetical protein
VPEAVRPSILVWGVLTVRVGLATRWRSGIRGYGLLWRRLEAGREDREAPFTVGIARAQLGGINAGAQLLPEAGAQRTLLAVSSMPLFGSGLIGIGVFPVGLA